MPSLTNITATLAITIGLTACATSINSQQETLNQNKEIALKLLTQGVVNFDREYIMRYAAPEYRQHNPVVADGRDGLLDFIDSLENQGTQINITSIRILAEGDLVMIHQQAQVNSDNVVAIDLFKISNNKIIEHWDVIQPEIIDTVNGHSMTGGVTDITDMDKTAENKQLVLELINKVFINQQPSYIDSYISPNYIQHSPFVADGRQGLKDFLEGLTQSQTSFRYTKLHSILAQGNFVFTQSEGIYEDKTMAFSDIWRIKNGKIIEHWDAVQEIPSQFMHDNGMF